MYCVMRASVPSVYRRYDTSVKIEMKGDRDGKSAKTSATRNCL